MRIDPNACRSRSVLCLAALLASLVPGSRALAAPASFAPTAAQCPQVDELSAAERARVRCGRLEVPENHALPEGRKIDIMVAVVAPPDNRPRDPLVLIHGGPGDGWVQHYRYRLAGSFGERTTIMFDQRGVGMSRPALCPELSDTLFETLTSGRPLTEQTASLVTASRGCHDHLIAQGVDPSQYNTMATVADLEALRTALGFSRWNLYGVSYGTTVGLAYLKQHPERIRALILDSVYPLDRPPAANVVANTMRSLHQLSLRCAAQPACWARYGDIEALLMRALTTVNEVPLELSAPDVDQGRPLRINAPALATALQQLLYDSSMYPGIPLLLDRIVARDSEPFLPLMVRFRGHAANFTLGALNAVECFERFPFDTRAAYDAASAAWPLVRDNMTTYVQHYDICAHWPERAQAPMQMPDRRDVPVLVLAGGWDPTTPAADSKATAERLGGFYVELPFQGHGARTLACGAPIVREFLGHPERMPDTRCVADDRPPEFASGVLRAPRLAPFLLSATARPGLPLIGLGLAVAALLSTWCWPLIALLRARRASSRAPTSARNTATLPLLLSATILLAYFVALGIALRAMLTSQSPLVLMIGLPRSILPLYALPWLALGCTLWALRNLLRGPLVASLSALHRWSVFAALVCLLITLGLAGLLIPELV